MVAMKSKTKKILLGCLAVFLIFVCTVVGLSLYLCSRVFDEKRGELVARVPDYKDLQSATDKIEAVLKLDNQQAGVSNNIAESLGLDSQDLEDIDPENLDFGELLKKVDIGKAMEALSQPGALNGTLEFNKDEVNALLDAMLSADQLQQEVADTSGRERDVRVYDAFFDNGRFTIKFSVDSKMATPFGRYCNIEIVFTPQIIDHHLKLDLYSTKVGTVDAPVSYFKSTIDRELEVYEQTEDGQTILAILTSLKVDKERLELKYDLQELSVFALEKLPQIQKLDSAPDKTEAILELLK